MTYRYLDSNGPAATPVRYELSISIYATCYALTPPPYVEVAIYRQDTGLRQGVIRVLSSSVAPCTTPYIQPGCTITGPSQPYQRQNYVGVVNLPASNTGYYALTGTSARAAGITNLQNPLGASLGLYVALAPPTYPNQSPVFADDALAIICAGDTSYLFNGATDADGDRLVYSFGEPASSASTIPSFTPPLPGLPYDLSGGYGASTPLGAGGYAHLDASSGLAQYYAPPGSVGSQYAVAVDVSEYRTINGQEVLLGTVRRDIDLIAAACPFNVPPVLPPPSVLPRNYTMEAGTTLRIPLEASHPQRHPLVLGVSSVLLNSTYHAQLVGGHTLSPATSPIGYAEAVDSGRVKATLVYTASCQAARVAPYDVLVLVQDIGCAGKRVATVLHVTVTKPSGPTALSGPAVVCVPPQVTGYSCSGGAAPGISWRLSGGGTLLSSPTASPVQVQWTTPGTYTLTARGVTQYGCLTDSVVQTVVVAPTLTVSGPTTICQGTSTTLAVSGGASYTLTGGGVSLSGSGPFTLSPGATTTYTLATIAGVAGNCPLSQPLTVTVQPTVVATAALPALPTQCPGTPLSFAPTTTNVGPAPTYQWLVNGQPAASTATFASSTLADGDVVQVVVTPTAGLCTTGPATASTQVQLVPVPLPAVSISAQTPLPVCAGTAITLAATQITNPGATPQYQWLVNGQPLAGATTPMLTTSTLLEGQLVTLQLTSATTCGPRVAVSAPVVAHVEEVVNVDAGPDQTIMEGDAVTLAGTASGSFPVQWSPSLGLSSATVLQPLATPTATTTYTLAAGRAPCTDQSRVTVTVTPRPRIPSAFSPNGDNLDDTWQIGNLGSYVGNRVVVFNRWGSKVFEATDYTRGNEWNGTSKGQPVPVGTYYYLITLPNGKRYTGPLTVVY